MSFCYRFRREDLFRQQWCFFHLSRLLSSHGGSLTAITFIPTSISNHPRSYQGHLCPEKTFLSSRMAFSAAALNPERFSPFHIHSTSYKTVNEHKIGVDVLVPKTLKAGTQKCPLMVRFHGGALVSNLISSPTISPFSNSKKPHLQCIYLFRQTK